MLPFLREGLVLEMHFNELVGTIAYDLSGYSNHGTIYGATRVNEGFVRALRFDGVDDYVRTTTISPSDAINTFPLTISLWLYYYPDLGKTYTYLSNRAAGYSGWFVQKSSANTFYIAVGTGTSFIAPTISLTTEGWIHAAFVIRGVNDDVILYVNGVRRDSKLLPSYASGYNYLTIGAHSGGYIPAKGIIEEVYIWRRVLTEEEIKELYYHGFENKFNITIGLLNNGYADLGNSFVAIVYLKNGTILQFPLILEDSLKRGSYLEKTITVDGYYPSYGLVDKVIVCSNDCQGVCSEVIVNNQC